MGRKGGKSLNPADQLRTLQGSEHGEGALAWQERSWEGGGRWQRCLGQALFALAVKNLGCRVPPGRSTRPTGGVRCRAASTAGGRWRGRSAPGRVGTGGRGACVCVVLLENVKQSGLVRWSSEPTSCARRRCREGVVEREKRAGEGSRTPRTSPLVALSSAGRLWCSLGPFWCRRLGQATNRPGSLVTDVGLPDQAAFSGRRRRRRYAQAPANRAVAHRPCCLHLDGPSDRTLAPARTKMRARRRASLR